MNSEWRKCTIADLGTIVTGKTPSTKKKEFWGGNIPFVTPKDIQNTKHILSTERYITEEGLSSVKGSVIPPDAICVSCIGNIGYTAKTIQKCVSNQQINTIITSGDNDNDFVFYLMRSLWPYFKNYEGQSTTLSILNKTQFSKTEICVPNLPTQRKIAGILSALDDKIELNNKINNHLEQVAQAIYKSWFVDFEPFDESFISEWMPSTLGEIANIKTNSWSPEKHPDDMVEHYSIPAFDEQHYPTFEIASGIKSNKYIITPDSVMISKLNPDTKRIWRPLCISENPVCSTEFIVYEAKKSCQRDYIYSVIDSNFFLKYLCSHTTGSTNSRQRATPKSTLDFPLLLPPDSVIDEFCRTVTPVYDLIASNIIENQSLTRARDTILPRLMSGELDVSDLDL